ncbi:hypothetical protein ASPFODRAFT_476999 [Aspergillus luchuensis CBS 106.47]|uniref:Uncharacterized protein n=1 Tax=Aspergillus luchuensis (strain CBS 106.47) TaxID=1137211 RepID=A0A1M3TQ84_ASPLC|nr:hypothetical protein ASPFODRAFT_476999 [Aspergillus luchuensis CBS 106.47]
MVVRTQPLMHWIPAHFRTRNTPNTPQARTFFGYVSESPKHDTRLYIQVKPCRLVLSIFFLSASGSCLICPPLQLWLLTDRWLTASCGAKPTCVGLCCRRGCRQLCGSVVVSILGVAAHMVLD